MTKNMYILSISIDLSHLFYSFTLRIVSQTDDCSLVRGFPKTNFWEIWFEQCYKLVKLRVKFTFVHHGLETRDLSLLWSFIFKVFHFQGGFTSESMNFLVSALVQYFVPLVEHFLGVSIDDYQSGILEMRSL